MIEMSVFDKLIMEEKKGSVFDMTEHPKRDVVAETRERVFETVLKRLSVKGPLMFLTAETGLGKTTGAHIAMKRVWDEISPDIRFLVLVRTKKDADEFYQDMEKLEEGCASVWTQTHDPEIKEQDERFEPCVYFTKHDAAKKRCLILTHNAGKAAEEWVGRRDAVLIDEYPDPVHSDYVKRSTFQDAKEDEATAPYAAADTWAQEQEAEQGLRTVGMPEWVYQVIETKPKSATGKAIKTLAEHMAAGTAFQRVTSPKMRWHWFKYDLPFEEKAIVLSATAHLEGWHFDPAQGGPIKREETRVDYRNVVARYHPWPVSVDTHHKTIVADPDQTEALLSYVESLNTYWDKSNLIVCPKDLRKHFKKRFPFAEVTHYGVDIGSNEYRKCTAVWLVSLYHQQNDTLQSKYLGHSRVEQVTDDTLEPGKNTRSKLFNDLKYLHHSTIIKQMGARGSCRNVDSDGVAKHMELNCIWSDRDMFTEIVPTQFPNCQLNYEGDSEPKTAKRKLRGVVSRTLEYLNKSDKDEVFFTELRDAGIKAKGKPYFDKILERKDAFSALGWRWVEGTPGRYGRPASFERILKGSGDA